MLNPGNYSLADRAITTALNEAQTPIIDLDGATAITLQARLIYGSGGTSAKVYVQTSLDQGVSWIDVACFAFVGAGIPKVANLSGLTARPVLATMTDGALADDTVVDGILGDRLRARIITTGTYSGNTVVSVRASVR